jgi:hypothetical protein
VGDNFSGTWKIEFIIGTEKVPATLTLRRQGSELTGSLEGPFPSAQIRNGTVGTSGFQFTSTVTLGGQTVEMTFTGNITSVSDGAGKTAGFADSIMRGTATSSIGAVPFNGLRLQES